MPRQGQPPCSPSLFLIFQCPVGPTLMASHKQKTDKPQGCPYGALEFSGLGFVTERLPLTGHKQTNEFCNYILCIVYLQWLCGLIETLWCKTKSMKGNGIVIFSLFLPNLMLNRSTRKVPWRETMRRKNLMLANRCSFLYYCQWIVSF